MRFQAVVEEMRDNHASQRWYYWVGIPGGPCTSGFVCSEEAASRAIKDGALDIKYPDKPKHRVEWEFEL